MSFAPRPSVAKCHIIAMERAGFLRDVRWRVTASIAAAVEAAPGMSRPATPRQQATAT